MEFDAQEKMSHAVSLMATKSPGLISFYMGMEHRENTSPEVMMRVGIDAGKPYIEYGTEFVETLEPSLLGALVYMNCLKVALHHCDSRREKPDDLYKLASDIVVAEYGRNIVDTSVDDNMEILNKLFPSIWSYWDVFSKYDFDPVKDLTLEKVFYILKDNKANRNNGNSDSSDNADATDGKAEEDITDSSSTAMSNDDSDENGNENDQMGTKSEQSDTENDESTDNESSGMGDDSVEINDNNEDWYNEINDSENNNNEDSADDTDSESHSPSYDAIANYFDGKNAEQELADWKPDSMAEDDIRSAADKAIQNGLFDNMRGHLPVLIRDANKMTIDTRSLFSNFLNSVKSRLFKPTWNMPNIILRRYGTIAPGRKRDRECNILLCVDVSGSMYHDNIIGKCIELMESIINGVNIDVCYWDAVCSPIFKKPKSMMDIIMYGGGYTNPQCVLNRLRQTGEHYDGMIFITDCEFRWNEPNEVRKIMIIQTPGAGRVPPWCLYHTDMQAVMNIE